MSVIGRLFAMIGLAATSASAAKDVSWPDLPTTGFTVGRVATVDDANQGNAAFSMDGKSAGVLHISIPQYVWWNDEGGVKHPMILIQAELAPDGTKIVGLRDFAGGETVATLAEIELLGTTKPR